MEKFNLMVQNYIKRMNNRGALITCSVANAAPKALIRKCLSVIDVIDVDFFGARLILLNGILTTPEILLKG